MKTVIFLILTLTSVSSYACRFAPSITEFIVEEGHQRVIPTQPSFTVSSINRGVKAQHSCSGLASLKLKLEAPVNLDQGYLFEIVKGEFKKISFRNAPVTVSSFMKDKTEWLFRYYEITNDPIDITLKIIAVSKSGEKSKPQYLQIRDPKKKSLWPSWSQRSH